MYNIVPKPKKIVFKEEKSNLSFPLKLNFSDLPFLSENAVFDVCAGAFALNDKSDVQFILNTDMAFDYEIKSKKEKIVITYKSGEGAFNALVTLWQIYKLNGDGKIHIFEISDGADLKNRGFMLDISRGKVPKTDTLKHLVDILARFKYNQFQLYIEGFSFNYPSFNKYCDENSSLSPEEIRKISTYCRERFIELVPNQNSLGHMSSWLDKKEFAGLAECEGGFSYGGFKIPPTTLNACDKKSLRLVEKMALDLFSCFDSDKIHLGLDESFELGRGKNADKDRTEIFIDYITKLNDFCKTHGKKMIMWSDGIHRFNCFGKNLPDDITYLEWGYEKEYPFDKNCKKLSENGFEFYVCPGTSSWLSFTGLTDNALENIDNAVNSAVKYDACGILLTDWGDCGHIQPPPVSYGAIAYCSAGAWNSGKRLTKEDLAEALDLFIFEDENRVMGKIALDSGNYYQNEEFKLPCRTLAHLFYSENIKSQEEYKQSLDFTAMLIKVLGNADVSGAYLPVSSKFSNENIDNIDDILILTENLKSRLDDADMKCADAKLIKSEYKTALDMVQLFTNCRKYVAQNIPLSDLKNQAENIAEEHRKNWLSRNKLSGLDNGFLPFYSFE